MLSLFEKKTVNIRSSVKILRVTSPMATSWSEQPIRKLCEDFGYAPTRESLDLLVFFTLEVFDKLLEHMCWQDHVRCNITVVCLCALYTSCVAIRRRCGCCRVFLCQRTRCTTSLRSPRRRNGRRLLRPPLEELSQLACDIRWWEIQDGSLQCEGDGSV